MNANERMLAVNTDVEANYPDAFLNALSYAVYYTDFSIKMMF